MGAESFRARVKLRPGPPAPVTVEDQAWASAVFPTKFASIETLCFEFNFKGDLLDPGERLDFHQAGVGSGFGFVNGLDTPQRSRLVCLQAGDGSIHDENIALYLDGKHTFTIVMVSGSVTIASVSVMATGVAD